MRCAIYALFLFMGSAMGLEDGLKKKEKDLTDRGQRQAASVCSEPGWVTRGSSCYLPGETVMEVKKANMTVSKAKQFCTEKGGYLAEIESPEEEKQVEGILGDGKGNRYWIGLERDLQAGKTIWQHSRHQLDWTNWHIGHQTYHRTGEHCFTMNVVGGKWGWSVHYPAYECDKSVKYPDSNIPTIALCEGDI